MWAHPPWVGTYLSAAAKGRELAEYAGWCNAVEGNTTFYAVPSERTVARWAEQAPSDFRFAFKVPKTITHERRLGADSPALLDEFLAALAPLRDRCGPIQLQLPPSFGPESMSALARFVGVLPEGHRWMVELRHPSLFDGGAAHRAVDDVLARAGVGRVVLDTRPLYADSPRTEAAVAERRQKPRLPVVTDVVGPSPIVRVIGGDDEALGLAGLAAWVPTVVAWLAEGRQPFVFAHQPENRESPDLARRFHAMVAAEVPDLTPLPDPLGQASLFRS